MEFSMCTLDEMTKCFKHNKAHYGIVEIIENLVDLGKTISITKLLCRHLKCIN